MIIKSPPHDKPNAKFTGVRFFAGLLQAFKMSVPILSKLLSKAKSDFFSSWIPFAALTLVLATLVAYQGWSAYQSETEDAARHAENLTYVLANEFLNKFKSVDNSLAFVVEQIKPEEMVPSTRSHYQIRVGHLLEQQVRLNHLSNSMHIYDAKGDQLYGSNINEKLTNVSDRDYFSYLHDHPEVNQYFSEKVVIGKHSQLPLLIFARVIRSQSGEFLGLASTSIPISTFEAELKRIAVGEHGAIAVRTIGDGNLIYRFPEVLSQESQKDSESQLQKALIDHDSGTLRAVSQVDGITRMFAYKKLSPYPYFINLGLDESDYLSRWRRNIAFTIFGAVILDALIGLFFARQRRAYKALNENLKVLEQSQAALRLSDLVITNTNDAVVITLAEPRNQAGGPPIVFVNEAYTRETGYLAEEVIGKAPSILQGSGTDRATLDRIRAALEKWQPVREEVLNYKKSGEVFWSELDIIPVADETGWYTHWISIQRNITERKLTEKAILGKNAELVKQAQELKDLYQGAPDAIILVENQVFIDCNPATLRLFGCQDRSDFIGKHPAQFSPPFQANGEDSMTLANQHMAEVIKNGKSLFEWTHCQLDGSQFICEVLLSPKAGSDGSVIQATVRDITERKLAQETIHLSEAKLRSLYELSPLGIARADMGGHFIEFNEAFRAITGYTNDELLTLDYWQLTPKKYDASEILQLKTLEETGRYGPYEKTYLNKDGVEIPVQLNGVLLKGADGENYIWSIVEDVSERKCAEAELEQAMHAIEFSEKQLTLNNKSLKIALDSSEKDKQRLSLAIHINKVGVWDWDLANDRKYWDDRMYEIYGVGREDFARDYYGTWAKAVHPEDQDRVKAQLQAAIQGHQEYRTHFRVVLPDGAIRHIDAAATVIRNGASTPVQMIGVNLDVTETYLAQESIAAGKAAAESALAAKTQFLSNMSHEIRTPMNGIIGLSTLALNQPLSPEVHDYLLSIESSAKSLLTILNDVLDFSKLEAGMVQMDHAPFQLQDLFVSVKNLFDESAKAKGLELVLLSGVDLAAPLIGDAFRIGQVLNNLIGNAIKFTEQGSVTFSVGLREMEGPNLILRFSVKDTGIGIPEESQQSLFDAFTQADNSITRRFGGTGLGLTISNQLLDLMDSKLIISSSQGQGSSFSFDLVFGTESAKKSY